jgi:hypothetical protein
MVVGEELLHVFVHGRLDEIGEDESGADGVDAYPFAGVIDRRGDITEAMLTIAPPPPRASLESRSGCNRRSS